MTNHNSFRLVTAAACAILLLGIAAIGFLRAPSESGPRSSTSLSRSSDPDALVTTPAFKTSIGRDQIGGTIPGRGADHSSSSRQNRPYRATFDPDGVTFTIATPLKGLAEPALRFTFRHARMEETTLASGIPTSPESFAGDSSRRYQRGIVEERYDLLEEGLEQTFWIHELPQIRGDVTITGTVETNLTAPAPTTGKRLSFLYEGTEAIFITKAVAVDASGRTLPLELSWKEKELSMTVPAGWLQTAELPIAIDPLIGTPITVSGSTQASSSDVAYNNTFDECLFAYIANGIVYAQRATGVGVLIGNPIQISSAGETAKNVSVNFASTANNYLIAWNHYTGAFTPGSVKGAVINTFGTIVKASFVISNVLNIPVSPKIAFGGTNWLLCYHSRGTTPYVNAQGNVYGVSIDTSGNILGGKNPLLSIDADASPDDAVTPSVVFANGIYVIVWIKNGYLAARTMNTSGVFLTPITLLENFNADSNPSVSGSPSGFLITWQAIQNASNPPLYYLQAMIVNSSLGVTVPAIRLEESSTVLQNGGVAYSSTDNLWYLTYTATLTSGGPSTVCARYISPTGAFAPYDYDVLTDGVTTSGFAPRVSWKPSTNRMVATFYTLTGVTGAFTARITPAPPTPSGLAATGLNSQVSLAWNPVLGASSYFVRRSTTHGGPYEYVGNPVTSSFVDKGSNVRNGTTYYYVVSAVNMNGESVYSTEVSATPSAPATVSCLFVVGTDPIPGGTGDNTIRTRLQTTHGYSVVVRSGTAVTSADALGKAFVLISSTTNAADVAGKFTQSPVGILTWNGSVATNLGMVSSSGTVSATSLSMVAANASHPLAAGRTGTVAIIPVADVLSWGTTGANAVNIATVVGDATKTILFGYDAGIGMSAGNAPARRTGFFLGNNTANALNVDGLALFDAAVIWTSKQPSQPVGLTVVQGNNQLIVKWLPSDNALSYKVLRSTNGGVYTIIAPGVTATYFVDTTALNGNTYSYQVIAQGDGGFSVSSTAATGSPNAQPIIVTVEGPSSISQGAGGNTFTASAQQLVNGTLVNVPFTGAWTFANVPNNPTGQFSIQNPTGNPATITTTGNNVTGAFTFTANVGGVQQSATFQVQANNRLGVYVMFRYPDCTNNQARTQRPPLSYPNTYLWQGTNEPETQEIINNRGVARYELFGGYLTTINNIWASANIQPNYARENVLGLSIPTTALNGDQFIADTRQDDPQTGAPSFPQSTGFIDLARKNITKKTSSDYINVYFVFSVWSAEDLYFNPPNQGRVNASTLQTEVRGPNRKTVLLSDTGDANTIAHEMGHVFGLPHITAGNQLDGPLADRFNNLPFGPGGTLTPAQRAILRENLMYSSPTGRGTTLCPGQGATARREIDAMRSYLWVIP